MNSRELHLDIDYVGSSGVVLTPEQKASMQTSLCILENQQKFDKVYFWGKILGINDDYFIAHGAQRNEFGERRFLYSTNAIHWKLLPPVTDEIKEKAKLIQSRFTGDPSYEFKHEIVKNAEDEDSLPSTEEIFVKEEDRLSYVISEIELDARIVPRGAFLRTPNSEVHVNREFEGLSIAEAAKLCNYVHFTAARKRTLKLPPTKACTDPAIDFMQPIDEDIPKGCWSLQFERGSGQVVLRSLYWLGLTFYHLPGTNKFGSIYWGLGQKNLDLPFML